MDSADAAMIEAVAASAKLVVDVACGKLRPLTGWQLPIVEAPLDPSLAVTPDPSYSWSHSKSLLASGHENVILLIKHRKNQEDFEFSCF
jgi:hypothetical protein